VRFELTDDQVDKYMRWTVEQHKKAMCIQKEKVHSTDPLYDVYVENWKLGIPYSGTIGGLEEFIFSPTSLGLMITVRNIYTGDELELTDFNMW